MERKFKKGVALTLGALGLAGLTVSWKCQQAKREWLDEQRLLDPKSADPHAGDPRVLAMAAADPVFEYHHSDDETRAKILARRERYYPRFYSRPDHIKSQREDAEYLDAEYVQRYRSGSGREPRWSASVRWRAPCLAGLNNPFVNEEERRAETEKQLPFLIETSGLGFVEKKWLADIKDSLKKYEAFKALWYYDVYGIPYGADVVFPRE